VRISERDNHFTSAILAYVQATAAKAQVSSEQLAAELLELWHHLTRGASQQLYGLIADLDISITQMKTLHARSTACCAAAGSNAARTPPTGA
jgi:hypothetical protein